MGLVHFHEFPWTNDCRDIAMIMCIGLEIITNHELLIVIAFPSLEVVKSCDVRNSCLQYTSMDHLS
jgi:hypothetical protein